MIGLYARVSTEEQAKKGFSLKDQIAKCREKAKTNDVIEYVDEGISGEFLDRPALSMLRQDVQEGLIKKVICLDPDRLSRKLMNQLILSDEIEKRAVLIFVNGEYQKTPEGMLFYQMRGAIAEFEKAKINERMSGGRRRKAREGKVVKDPNIYGYSYDKENARLIINEKEAEVVKIVFDLFTKPNHLVKGINGIAHYLTDRKIPTKRGVGVWHRQVVRQMLMNEVYTGHFYHNRWNTEGMLGNKHKPKEERVPMTERPRDEWIEIECPVIINEEIFSQAQKLLKESRRRWTKNSKHSYLLSGLLRCGKCGNTLTGRRSKNWGKAVFEYTDRKNYAGAKHQGCGLKLNANKLDEKVWKKVRDWLHNSDEILAVGIESNSENSFEETEVVRIENELTTIFNGRKRLLSLFAEGIDLSEEDIRDSFKELKEKETYLRSQLTQLKEILANKENKIHSQQLIKEAATFYLDKGEDELSFEDKQQLIRHVVREIRVTDLQLDIFTF
ncbi:recombinase family protein [Bacillus chungangensis]|uniref:Site-specific DNA recombinase n=1 Tax=Bacillus chungangensis TaxID=587633 RepID=A0ABT9WM87_9BACI|nr:recombinase family protein [Bacillus chungangensis]MDQ0174229.1 site-specific DNA recombinase [Bacillus chungangensis]